MRSIRPYAPNVLVITTNQRARASVLSIALLWMKPTKRAWMNWQRSSYESRDTHQNAVK